MSTETKTGEGLTKKDVPDLLRDMADLLEIAGENPFKLRAYREGADIVEELTVDEFQRRVREDTLDELDGIGDALSDKITQAVETGTIEKFEETKAEFPVSLLDVLDVHGIGPKSVRKMYDELGIENLTELESALQTDKLEELDGFGPKTIENIKQSLDRFRRFSGRVLLMDAIPVADDLIAYIEETSSPERIEVAGSYRRGKETVGDLDILVTGDGDHGDTLVDHPDVEDVLGHGDTKTSVLMESDLQVDLREVESESFGAALLYFTGSKEHNVRLRGRARDRGWTINEYGLFDEETGEKLAGETEASIYEALELNWIPPELREDHGEIDRAAEEDFSDLVELDEIRGDCHVHTTASDGRDSLEDMVGAARERGSDYMVITEHSQSLRVADGLSPDRLRDHAEQVRQINEEFDDIEVFAGTESDILEDGSMDYEEDLLAELDLVIAAVHSKFNLPRDKQTERVVTAVRHPEVDVLAHPTGRKLGQRDPYEIEMEPVLKAAAEEDVIVEINANGQRLDANDQWCRRGREMGVQFIVNTDAHATDHLWFSRLGVKMARRGHLTTDEIVNTGPSNAVIPTN
jgi:DNA polymerase (family 10)